MSRTAIGTLALVFLVCGRARADDAPPSSEKPGAPSKRFLTLKRSIALPDVVGRMDHMALDAEAKVLVLAAIGNGSAVVVDLPAGKVVKQIRGLKSPLGAAFGVKASAGTLFVSCGEDWTLRAFDATTYEPRWVVTFDGDSGDAVVVEGATGRVFTGFGDGATASIEAGEVKQRVPLAAHPEAICLEPSGPRMFVNVPDAHHVAVVDRTEAKVTAKWDVHPAEKNYAMALDAERRRLFVGCRAPAKMLVLDASVERGGALVASVPISGDVDDLSYDARTGRIYASCAAGFVDVVEQTDADHYRILATVATAPDARTSVLSPDGRHLYVAVPRTTTQQAEIRDYATDE